MTGATYGEPTTLTARVALLKELGRTDAHVEWLRLEVAGLTAEQLVRGTRSVRRTEKDGTTATTSEAGVMRHPLLQLYIEERRHLRDLCRDALALPDDEGSPRRLRTAGK